MTSQKKPEMAKDPEGIDDADAPRPGQKAEDGGSVTNQMVAELDAMNKYMQGVNVPQAL